MMQSGSMLFLNEHQVIRLEDDDDILLSVVTDGRVADTFTVDYPSAGYGGGELYLSPATAMERAPATPSWQGRASFWRPFAPAGGVRIRRKPTRMAEPSTGLGRSACWI